MFYENITVDIDAGIRDFQELANKWGQGFVKGYCHVEPIFKECIQYMKRELHFSALVVVVRGMRSFM